jgi:hypothetical protein
MTRCFFFLYCTLVVPQLGTILLVALPLGAVLCFFDLLGARALARGEVRIMLLFLSGFPKSRFNASCRARPHAGGPTEHFPWPPCVST